ncbi:MAG: FAD-binding oxidoreductase, partial [Longimicrobiales bacterium]
GVEYAMGTAVQGILQKDGRVTGVETTRGTVRCDMVVNAAGAHAYHIAMLVGLDLPIVPVRHEFLVSVESAGLEPDLPVLRSPDATLYARAEVNGLLLGGWEPRALSVEPDSFPLGSAPPRIAEDWEVLAAFAQQLAPLYGKVNELGIRSVFKGWPTFTPDGRFIIGESSRVKGFVMAGGCNAHGVSGSAGIGRHVVESILEDEPSPYVTSLSPDRFTETAWDWHTAGEQARRVYETYYAIGH